MAATYGQIQEFCPEIESIEAYIECVELYFEANNIDTDRQVAVFLSVIGGKNYTLLRHLLSPEAEYLDQALQDRLVCKLRSEATQKHLLLKSELMLKQSSK